MPRKRRPLDREGGVVRDASLIIVASEDTYAVRQYFSRFKTRRVQFIVAHTEDCNSSPRSVMDRLISKANEYATEPGDTFWLCIDRDRWPAHILANVANECRNNGYQVAISHPCFELWLLLHFEMPSETYQRCDDVCAKLRFYLGGGYGPHCCKTALLTEEMVLTAMERARAIDTNPTNTIPTSNVTHVYRILDALLARDSIKFT